MVGEKMNSTSNKSKQFKHEYIFQLLIEEAGKGLDDIASGRITDARSAIKERILRRNQQSMNKTLINRSG